MAEEKSGISAQVRIGSLDRKIVIQTYGSTQNSSGEMVKAWTTLGSVWAKVEKQVIGSDEEVRAAKITTEERTFFTIRYKSYVTTLNRIVYQGKEYDIKLITEIGRRQYLKIEALSQS